MEITADQQQQLNHYLDLVKGWNTKINLVSRKDIDNVAAHHLQPCLIYSQLDCLKSNSRVLDIGSGGGFPGIVNAILFPTCHFVLIDSTRKKVEALTSMVKELQLHNVETVWDRVEHYHVPGNQKFDYVTSRAVASLAMMWSWTKPLMKAGGSMLAMKGGDVTGEIAELPNGVKAEILTVPDMEVKLVKIHSPL